MDLVAALKQYATDHYNDGGWDVVVECYTDDEIADRIGDAKTLDEAVDAFDALIDVWRDRQADARNSAF